MEVFAADAASVTSNDGETTRSVDSGRQIGRRGRFQMTMEGEQHSIGIATNKVSGGSAMPLCGIVLPLSKRPTDSAVMLFFPLANVRLHNTHSSSNVIPSNSLIKYS